MLLTVMLGFVVAMAAPWLVKLSGRYSGWLLALYPFSLVVYFAQWIPVIGQGHSQLTTYQWFPGLDISLSLYLDGLSLLFALLISIIGTFVLIYAGSYLKGHKDLGRFYLIIIAFMASMLGLVLADNVITLFVFWELTSITSYFLIGFQHEQASARKAALQGLFVTVGGGLCLLAGFVLLAIMGGSYSIQGILSSGVSLPEHGLYGAALVLVLLGAFTKSAQFPFHFWLPNAMAAPTPVSAFLHSATMVKAGVYLLARLNPGMASDLWSTILTSVGALTVITAVVMALSHRDMKKILAYSTVMALGTLVMLLGIGTELALTAFVVFLLAHSLYKGALFMLAGAVDHAVGTKDLSELSGLRKAMPVTALLMLLAAMSLAGIPPLFGFIAKELLFESLLQASVWGYGLLLLFVFSAILLVAVAAALALKPFYGQYLATPKTPHEPPVAELLGPVVLIVMALLLSLFALPAQQWLLSSSMLAVAGYVPEVKLALWHGVNMPLMLSAVSLVLGIMLWTQWHRVQPWLSRVIAQLSRFGPERGYFKMMDGITWSASWQTRFLQNGVLGLYMVVLILSTFLLAGYTFVRSYGLHFPLDVQDSYVYEWVVAFLLIVSALFASTTRYRLAAVAAMGVLGFAVALTFIHFSAPDLGITQLLVETLTVILLVLVLFKLPEFVQLSSPWERARDIVVALFGGVVMLFILVAAIDIQYFDSISSYYIDNSELLGYGRNIVNVILVDFRVLDTLGEIFVLALAALGVLSMIKLRAEDRVK
ncbi:MAG: putative monovalent cation/H+ antiporter subunit A [Bacterioplanes sp.]|nr:putative monovalent cation/H+ antiporter subunit A [Bacterioplanes sp.]